MTDVELEIRLLLLRTSQQAILAMTDFGNVVRNVSDAALFTHLPSEYRHCEDSLLRGTKQKQSCLSWCRLLCRTSLQ